MVCVQVNAKRPASAQLFQGWRPSRLGLPGGVQVPAVSIGLGQPPATPAHRYPSRNQSILNLGQLGLQMLQPTLLGISLRLGCVAVDPALPATNRDVHPHTDGADAATQRDSAVHQVGQDLGFVPNLPGSFHARESSPVTLRRLANRSGTLDQDAVAATR
jgi:hypothetical protein